MIIQVLALGPLVVAFAVAAPHVFPHLLGGRWDGVSAIFPFLALSAIADSVFSFHSQVLHVLDRSWSVALFNASRLALFTIGCLLFLPQHALLGYGYAEALSFLSYAVVHALVSRGGLRLSYGLPLAFQALFALALFSRELGWPFALAPLAIVVWPGTWTLGSRYLKSFLGQ
jgi:O-antigen/teichoic acid export membrane protein